MPSGKDVGRVFAGGGRRFKSCLPDSNERPASGPFALSGWAVGASRSSAWRYLMAEVGSAPNGGVPSGALIEGAGVDALGGLTTRRRVRPAADPNRLGRRR